MGEGALDAFEQILGDVYDCAVNPDLWLQTLERIRATLGCAYVMFGYADLSLPSDDGIPMQQLRSTSWDAVWFKKLEGLLQKIPGSTPTGEVAWTCLGRRWTILTGPRFNSRNSMRNGCDRRDSGTE